MSNFNINEFQLLAFIIICSVLVLFIHFNWNIYRIRKLKVAATLEVELLLALVAKRSKSIGLKLTNLIDWAEFHSSNEALAILIENKKMMEIKNTVLMTDEQYFEMLKQIADEFARSVSTKTKQLQVEVFEDANKAAAELLEMRKAHDLVKDTQN